MGILAKKTFDNEEITTYKSQFNFDEFEIEDNNIIKEIEQKEEVLKQNIIKNLRSREQIAKNLYEIQEILANQKTGTFLAYLEYVGFKKDKAYNLIGAWELKLRTNSKKVFDLPQRLLTEIKKEIKKNENIENTEIIEIIESDNPKERIEKIKEKRISEIEGKNLTGSLKNELKKIEKEIEKYMKKIALLEEKKEELEKRGF